MKWYYVVNFILGFVISYTVGLALLSLTEENLQNRTEPVFVYGTLNNPVVRAVVCHCIAPTESATLLGYTKSRGSIELEDEQVVKGGITAVTPEELKRIDRFKHVPSIFQRIAVSIEGKTIWTYQRISAQ